MHQPKIIKRGFGWRPDRIDERDHRFDHRAVAHIPEAVDLRPTCPPHYDQLTLGSCTAHGTIGAIRQWLIANGHKDAALSRLFLYWVTRFLEGTTNEDSGAEIRNAIKAANQFGTPVEPMWPYNIDRFKQQPFQNVYAKAVQFEIEYQRVGNEDGTATADMIKAAIASGHPVVGGFTCFKQFSSEQCARDGKVAMPEKGETSDEGHCTYFPAYGQMSGYTTGRNSYSDKWGDQGDFYLPDDYFNEGLATDFWIITKVGLQA